MDFVKNLKLGLSIGNTLDSVSEDLKYTDAPSVGETAWGNPVITKQLVDTILATGINLIRVPVSWGKHLGPAPDYAVAESWMNRIQEVVDYAYKQGAYVILNCHHEDWNIPTYDNREKACERIINLWTQIAERFQDYGERLIFEGQNEPRKIGSATEWTGGDEEGWDIVNVTNKAFIETIRKAKGFNPKRYLMIPGYAANSTVGIRHLEIPKDDGRIIASVHAYVPCEFALEIPGRSDWKHDTAVIDRLMKDLKELFIDRGIPVILGEFGAMNKNNEAERAEWVTYYLTAAKKIGVPCVWWDNGLFDSDGENFGLFDRYTYEVKYPVLFQAMLQTVK